METLKKAVLFCDKINDWIGSYIVTSAVFLFILVIFSNVIMRYVFNTSFVFMAELEWHVFAFIFLLGAGFTLLHDGIVAYKIGEVSIDPGGIPARFLLKATLPAGYFLMLIQGFSLFVKSVFILMDKPLENYNAD